MALAKPGPVELTWKGGGLLARGRQQPTIMISAYIALLTHSRNLEMCPCKLRFILFKHKNFVFFFVFLVHNT
jgi:hypothetical protein